MKATVDVLLVEDNPADAELVIESLRLDQVDERLQVVRDGAEALDFLFARGAFASRKLVALPRLILLDIKLPKVDGFGVLRELRADARTRAVPVVVLTSSLVERDVAECYRLGISSYVQKPVDFEQFREVVQLVGRYWLEINAAPPPSVSSGEV
jgi:CheY-like chemotaxis protein